MHCNTNISAWEAATAIVGCQQGSVPKRFWNVTAVVESNKKMSHMPVQTSAIPTENTEEMGMQMEAW